MKKLTRKNHEPRFTIEAYYVPCTCLCAVCQCWNHILWIGDNSSSNGINLDISYG